MRDGLWTKSLVIGIIILFLGASILPNIKGEFQEQEKIMMWYINGPPTPLNTSNSIVSLNLLNPSAVVLNNVPTSTYTYGCVATSVGMLFGYYDRVGYRDMYTGPDNGGVCPLTNLGQGTRGTSGYPAPGSCYIIATEKGLDGITSKAHVDDYWISLNSPGPDPWETHWPEHTWSLCVADFIGANQWKWDTNNDGKKDSNFDGGSTYWYNTDGSKLYDYIPPASQGLPQTEVGHGCKLFAESRGYTVITNYNQLTNTPSGNPNGFTFNEFQAEINAGRPVITHWRSSTVIHTMLGVGYDASTETIYFHDTWDNNLHHCTWTGAYSGYGLLLTAVTVIKLGNAQPNIPSNPNPTNGAFGVDVNADLSWTCSDFNGDPLTYDIYFGTASNPPLVKSHQSATSYDPGTMSKNTKYYWKVVAWDNHGTYTDGNISYFMTTNYPPDKPNLPSGEQNGKTGKEYTYTCNTSDPNNDQVYYFWDWGDGNNSGWLGPYNSGATSEANYTWNIKGNYTIKVKAKDIYNTESNWSDPLPIIMPYSYEPRLHFLELLFQRFPNVFPILRHLLGY